MAPAAKALRSSHDVAAKLRPATPRQTRDAHITFLNPSSEIGAAGTIPEEGAILQADKTLKVDIDHFCRVLASCSTCRVAVVEADQSLSGMVEGEGWRR